MNTASLIAPQRARGTGRLTAKWLDGRTRLAELYQEGCAKIRLPETFSGEMEAVLINSSGGLTGGDRMDWMFRAGEKTRLMLTTQACEKVYKASGGVSAVSTRIAAGPGAAVHWLPQETILFDHAFLDRLLDADLAADAEFLAVEAVLLGRRMMGEVMRTGLFRDRWRIRREGRLLHAENLKLDGAIDALTAAAPVLGGQVAFASVFYTGPSCESLLSGARRLLEGQTGGVSHWQCGNTGEKLVARLAAPDGFALRKILIPLISHLRKGAPVPKVWNL